MKRSGPLTRKAPLRSHSTLKRSPLSSSGKAAAAQPARAQRRQQRDTGPSRKVCQVVDARAGGWCEWPGCTERGVDRQHRLGRKMGGRHGAMRELLNGVEWLLRVCRHHHDQVTDAHGEQLQQAKDWGWVLTEDQDARLVPVMTRHWPTPVLLDGAGQWSVAA